MYQSEHCANNAAFLINLDSGEGQEKGMKPYECPYCERWHIGHSRSQP